MRSRLLGSLLLLGLFGLCPAAEQVEQVSLRPNALPAPALTMTHQDLSDNGKTLLLDGQVRTGMHLTFANTSSGTQPVTVGPLQVSIGLRGTGLLVELNGASQQIRPRGNDMPPIVLPLPNQSRHILAIPIVSRTRTQTELHLRSGVVYGGRLGRDTVLFYDSNHDTVIDRGDSYSSSTSPHLFAPITELVLGGRDLYTVSGIDHSEREPVISYAPYEGPTGEFRWTPRGGQAQITAVYTGADGRLAFVADPRPGRIPVPPGSYGLSYGMVLARHGGRHQVVARIIPADYAPIEVTEDGGGEAPIGGPFTLRFTATRSAVRGKTSMAISPASLRVFGAAGEEYREYQWANLPSLTMHVPGRRPVSLGGFSYG